MKNRLVTPVLLGLVLVSAAVALGGELEPIFDGKSAKGWMTNQGKALPDANVQTDGLNPHKSGGYIIVHEKPHGEWNHMTITAKGPRIDVAVNGETVSSIDLDAWKEAGKRPDGSAHKFTKVVVKDMARKGYVGFQDHGQDCWYKNVKVEDLD